MHRWESKPKRNIFVSDSPPERDLEWSESGIEGASRFVQRGWKLATTNTAAEGEDDALRRKTHRAVSAVGFGVIALGNMFMAPAETALAPMIQHGMLLAQLGWGR